MLHLRQISAKSRVRLSTSADYHKANTRQYEEYLYAILSEYFEANMMRMMRINGVCEYTKTCEYKANKIHIRLDSIRSE